ncbi:MAG TPA: MarR family transcriptional regulator [Dehalococcoidia bacterium]|nr:MarR family transcriptional regulator [Dehalococcoidia bacterium]
MPAAVSLRQEAEDALLRLLPAMRKRFESEIPAELGSVGCITAHQAEAVFLLRGASPSGLTMNELARAQGCALSTATSMVDRLIRMGLAERISDDHDRRVVRIRMTETGRTLSGRFAELKHRLTREALDRLDDDEVQTLVRLLHKMAGAPVEPGGIGRD